jgi:hypothetical protein
MHLQFSRSGQWRRGFKALMHLHENRSMKRAGVAGRALRANKAIN